jgi:hypothetical protein
MDAAGGVNARVDGLLAATAAAAAARRARTYQEWRADVFEAIQGQVDAHMSRVDAAALEARLLARYNAFLAADAPTTHNARGNVFREGPPPPRNDLGVSSSDAAAAAAAGMGGARIDASRVRDPVKADLRRRDEEREAMRAAAAIINGDAGGPSHGFEFGGAHEAPRELLTPAEYAAFKETSRFGRWTDKKGNAAAAPPRAGAGVDAFNSAVRLEFNPASQPRSVLDAELPPLTRARVPGSAVAATMLRGGASGESWEEAKGRRAAPAAPPAGAAPMGGVLAHAHRGATPPRGTHGGRVPPPRGPDHVAAPERARPAGGAATHAGDANAKRRIGAPRDGLDTPLTTHYGRKPVAPPASGVRGAARGMFDVMRDREGGELDRPSWTNPPVQAGGGGGSGGSSVSSSARPSDDART